MFTSEDIAMLAEAFKPGAQMPGAPQQVASQTKATPYESQFYNGITRTLAL
jgi:hypothetical protein